MVILPNKKSEPTDEDIEEEVKCWKKNPAVKQFFWEMFEDRFKERENAMIKSVTNKVSKKDQENPKVNDKSKEKTPDPSRIQPLKSLLDTTIYKPAFQVNKDTDRVINQISNFVEGIRIESADQPRPPPLDPPPRIIRTPQRRLSATPKSNDRHNDNHSGDTQPDAKEISDNLIMGADPNKAILCPPTGEFLSAARSICTDCTRRIR